MKIRVLCIAVCFGALAFALRGEDCNLAISDSSDKVQTYKCCDCKIPVTFKVAATCCDDPPSPLVFTKIVYADEADSVFPTSVIAHVTVKCGHGTSASTTCQVALEPAATCDMSSSPGDLTEGTTEADTTLPEEFTISYEILYEKKEDRKLKMSKGALPVIAMPRMSPSWRMSLGRDGAGNSSGMLEFSASSLFSAGEVSTSAVLLRRGATSGLDVVLGRDGEWRQIMAKECFVQAEGGAREGVFSISFYEPTSVEGDLDESGSYVLKRQAVPFVAYDVGPVQTNGARKTLSLVERRGGVVVTSAGLLCESRSDGTVSLALTKADGTYCRGYETVSGGSGGSRQRRFVRSGSYESTEDREYAVVNGRKVLAKSVRTCAGVEHVTTYEHDSQGNMVAEISPSGLRTEYDYDDAGRRVSRREFLPGATVAFRTVECEFSPIDVRPHVPGGASPVDVNDDDGTEEPDLPRVETEYAYGEVVSKTIRFAALDSMKHRIVEEVRLSETETYEYDALGRTIATTDAAGIVTKYLYATDATAGLESRTTIRAFGTDCAVTNTTISYADGRTKETLLNGIVKTAYEYGPNWTKTYEGPAGVASPRWSCSYEDALGRVIAETRPGFRGALLITSNEYNTANQLIAVRNYALNENSTPTPQTYTYFCYNILGQRNLSVEDMNLNNQIDWNDTDRIVSNDVRFVMLEGGWWRESSSWQTRQNGSPERALMGRSRTRLTGLGNGLVSETRSFDPLGNETITCSYRDRTTHTTAQTTQTPTSSLTAETIARCGLTVSSRSTTGVTTTYSYDALGRQTAQTDGRGNTSQVVYDAQGRVTKTIDPLGNETTYAYDALGRQVAVTDPLGNTVTTAYDAEGRVLAQRGATYPVDYAYDAYGNKVSMTTYRDEALANGDTTRWLYDEPSGCMTNKVYADGKGPSYDYTPDGKLARRTWARGIVTDYTYDNAGNLTRTEYNDNGVTPTITMSYDRVGNLINATTAGVVTNLYAYDIVGNCTNEWQNDFQLTRFYDALGRNTGYAINGTCQTTIAYDTYGRIVTMSTGEGRAPSRPQAPFTWSYHPNTDLKASLTYPNGLTASWQYDANNQLIQVRNATPTNIISQFDYMYDAAGRRVSITKSGTAFGDLSGSVDTYTYNARSELISARRTKNGQPIPGFSEDFDYDPIGNRRSSATYNEKGEAQTSTYAANNLNQYTSRTTPGCVAVRGEADPNATVTVNENPTFRLGSYYFGSDLFDNTSAGGHANLETYATLSQTAQNGEEAEDLVSATTNQVYLAQSPETFAYDDDGNQTLITTKTGQWRVTYNGENRPVLWVRDSDNTTLTMSYDHMGRRREKNAQRFFYDGYLQVADNSGNVYTWDSTETVATRPLAWFNSSHDTSHSALYYAHDGNKNVSEVIAADCSLAAHYDYTPFGAVILKRGESAATNPWRFSSEYAEAETATVYYNYRHYEPIMGRWTSRDPMLENGGVNVYSMVVNAPNNRPDRLGLVWTGTISKSGGTLSYSEPIEQIILLNDFGGRIEMSTSGLTTVSPTGKSRAECVNGSAVPVKTTSEWSISLLPPALGREVVESHGEAWQRATAWTVEEYLVYTVMDVSLSVDGVRHEWSEEFCKCFKLTYGISSHGSAYVNNFGVAAMAVAVVAVPQTLPELAVALRDALAPRTFPIPSLL